MKSLTRRSTVSLPGRKLHRIRYAVSLSRRSRLARWMFSAGMRKPPASMTPASTAAWRCWLGRTPSRPAGRSNVPLTRPPQTRPPLPPATLHKHAAQAAERAASVTPDQERPKRALADRQQCRPPDGAHGLSVYIGHLRRYPVLVRSHQITAGCEWRRGRQCRVPDRARAVDRGRSRVGARHRSHWNRVECRLIEDLHVVEAHAFHVTVEVDGEGPGGAAAR